jgi:hypothetical protein
MQGNHRDDIERIRPRVGIPCRACRIFPRSLVGVMRTRGPFPAMVRTPTVFSGFDCMSSKVEFISDQGRFVENLGDFTGDSNTMVSR